MKAVVIDTNILFAMLRVANHPLRETLDRTDLHFYSPNFIAVEIFKHKDRILTKSSLTEDETIELLSKLIARVTLVNEDQISTSNFIKAFLLCKEVDEKDTLFVALALELNAEIWTRDKELKQHLKNKGFNHFFEP